MNRTLDSGLRRNDERGWGEMGGTGIPAGGVTLGAMRAFVMNGRIE
ncbi:MAG: hypothetical protein ABIH23_12695 [bacterium]